MDSGQEERRKSIKMMEEIPSAKDDEDPFLDIKRMQPHEVVSFLSNYLNATQLEGIAPLLDAQYVGDIKRLETNVHHLESRLSTEQSRAEDAEAEAARLGKRVEKLEKQLGSADGANEERLTAEVERLRGQERAEDAEA